MESFLIVIVGCLFYFFEGDLHSCEFGGILFIELCGCTLIVIDKCHIAFV